ncbi:hypothetical protein N9X40_03385 [bacterium]|jgi:hypothetical protein|nr:hypothetical protein [bacterium]
MAKQLIFCSVPHGLQPGRSGYCLVAGHTELPQTLIRQLEQETSVFPPEEKEDHAAVHEIKKIGETEWHIFSRQTTGIKDYTGRFSGLTHVVVERDENLPDGLDPKTVLWKFKSWVTAIPDQPKAYGAAEEIHLDGMYQRKATGPTAETKEEEGEEEDSFRLNPDANRARPAPRPRSGMYYDGKRRGKGRLWGLALLIVLGVVAWKLFFS